MTESNLILILLIHFLADFALQTDYQAKNKYKWDVELAQHAGTYSLCWVFGSYVILQDVGIAVVFGIITFVAHFITDGITSNISKKYFDKGDYHNGFVVIGADQVLHYIQLYLTFKLFL